MESASAVIELLPEDTLTPRHPDLEGEVVRRARAGDLTAFEQVYRSHLHHVHGLAARMVHDPALAEDLTQDVFVAAWRALPSFRGESAFSTWLYRLAIRVVLKGCRNERRHDWQARDAGVRPARQQPRSPELRIDVERAVAALPVKARMILILHDILGFRNDEIAALIGRAAGTVKSQLHRARKLLAAAMAANRQ
jgi:RNA polymerase sigma factor (sigma-70 family)